MNDSLDPEMESKLGGQRILVTGGAGFIGSHLTSQLSKADSEVKVLDSFDDFYPGKRNNLKRFKNHDNLKLIRGSILDRDLVKDLCEWSTLVFHEAGQAGIRYCNRRPRKAHRINVEGTLNILLACREDQSKRIVYASSSSVYGDIQKLPISEDHPKTPMSPYAASKLAAEHYCQAFHHAYSTDVVRLRYFSVYGPSQRPDLVITIFANKLYANQRPTIFGDGTHSRDFTYVSDIVDGTINAAVKEGISGMVFNLGKGERTTVKALLDMMRELMGKEEIDPKYEEEFPGEFPHTQADISKARRYLGYKPRISLEEGLRMYLDWFLGEKRRGD